MKDMISAAPDLAALLAQRLCHDLVNPLGALGNGLELLEMSQPATPEMALMRDSLEQALGRIKLYRLAFGPASTDGIMAGVEVQGILRALGGSRSVELVTDLPASLGRSQARLVALMALCAETALAWGGRIEIAVGAEIRLSATAERLRLDAELWEPLSRGLPPETPTPPQVHFALLPAAAAAAGCSLSVETGKTRLVLTA
jgi:histidine phosphotransferase ChpT